MSGNGSRGQWIAVGVIVAMLGATLTLGVLLSEDIFQVQPGADAPGFEAISLSTGDTVTLADYRGEVVLLNLWATWCAPCRIEMPAMERLYQELGPEGLKVVAVSVDQIGGDKVLEFAQELKLTFDILQDRSGQIELDYQATGLPESLILDREGVIVHKEIGPVEWDSPVQKARFRRLLGVETSSATTEASAEEPVPREEGSTGG